MKKTITTILLLVLCFRISAQGWQVKETEADELKGTKACTVHVFTQPDMGSFVIWDIDEYQFRIVSESNVFNYESATSLAPAGELVFIGLYDNNDKLKDKFKMWLDKETDTAGQFLRTRDMGGMFNPVGQKGKVKKIFNHLKAGEGYVRIVASRYNASDFDLKILPFPKE